MRLGDVVQLNIEHFPDPDLTSTFPGRGHDLNLEHGHVATVFASAFEQPPDGCGLLPGGD
jgi:hypothetical protein